MAKKSPLSAGSTWNRSQKSDKHRRKGQQPITDNPTNARGYVPKKKGTANGKLQKTIRQQQVKFNRSKCLLRRSLKLNLSKMMKQELKSKNLLKRRKHKNSSISSLEEGEICSNNEETQIYDLENNSSKNFNTEKDSEDVEDNDDDCICIGTPEVQKKTRNDTLSDTATSLKTSFHKGFKECNNFLTSTPCQNPLARIFAGSNFPSGPSTHVVDPAPELFYEDKTRSTCCETINSTDTFTNYTKLSQLCERKKKTKSSSNSDVKKDLDEYDDDIIVIDDSSMDNTSLTLKPTKQESTKNDDSVIFVGENNPNDFISINLTNEPDSITSKKLSTPQRNIHNFDNSLFTRSEKKELIKYNSNAYNPSAGTARTSQKRMVLIDGSNVAFHHALNNRFSVKGLQIAIEYFEKMGHEVKAVVPLYRMHKSTDSDLLQRLHQTGKIVLTPCKNLPGKSSTSYDDRFILQLACELDAVVVSNDNYRDLINENSAFKKVIENRVIGYSWCNDIFILPKDPYGRWGPPLSAILNRV